MLLARAFTVMLYLCLLCSWGGSERWQCRENTICQPTADFSFERLSAPFEELAVFFWGVWCMICCSRTQISARTSEVVRGTHLDVDTIFADGWRWSHFGDGVIEFRVADVSTKLVKDRIALWAKEGCVVLGRFESN
jgi:hypothetical protein